MQANVARGSLLPRPMVGTCPLVRAALKGQGFRLIKFAFVLEIVSEPGGLDLRAKIIAGGASEMNLAETAARAAPPTVVPRTQHDKVVIGLIEFLEGRVGRERPVIVFLVPPATDDERCHPRRF